MLVVGGASCDDRWRLLGSRGPAGGDPGLDQSQAGRRPTDHGCRGHRPAGWDDGSPSAQPASRHWRPAGSAPSGAPALRKAPRCYRTRSSCSARARPPSWNGQAPYPSKPRWLWPGPGWRCPPSDGRWRHPVQGRARHQGGRQVLPELLGIVDLGLRHRRPTEGDLGEGIDEQGGTCTRRRLLDQVDGRHALDELPGELLELESNGMGLRRPAPGRAVREGEVAVDLLHQQLLGRVHLVRRRTG